MKTSAPLGTGIAAMAFNFAFNLAAHFGYQISSDDQLEIQTLCLSAVGIVSTAWGLYQHLKVKQDKDLQIKALSQSNMTLASMANVANTQAGVVK